MCVHVSKYKKILILPARIVIVLQMTFRGLFSRVGVGRKEEGGGGGRGSDSERGTNIDHLNYSLL